MKQFIKEGTLTKYEKESGKLRMSGGCWTINMDKVKLESLQDIVYITERYKYEIPKQWAVKNGFMQMLGGELKLIVPIKYWVKNALPI
jgi:hypothetical protein